jgi:hypothetical protein
MGDGGVLRASLEADLLRPEALHVHEVGGGKMCYHRPRPALPPDLQALVDRPDSLGLGRSEHARVCVALVLIARDFLDAAHDIVGEEPSAEATSAPGRERE